MTISPIIKRDYLHQLAQKGKRIDNRAFNEYRPVNIEVGIIEKAEGSARVTIGNTQVVAGIKMDIGEPYPDTPNQGVMSTAAELIPLASPDFEAGPPREDAIELARVVDRGIRESEVIKFDELCIVPGVKIWLAFIDIHVIDYDGNLFDASSLAALAALLSAKVPIEQLREKLEPLRDTYPEVGAYLDAHPTNYPLPVRDPQISCTFVKFNNAIVVDPLLDEDEIAEVRLTVAIDEKEHIRAMQKGLNGSFSVEEIKNIIKEASINGKGLRAKLKESIGR
jgi:exosome complex component RRP42